MRKVLITILILFSIPVVVNSQDYGYEWIDFNKTYFKVAVAQDGIYRLTFTDLSNAGFPVSSVDPRRIQLFHRGVEQAIDVAGQGDAVFNTTDYIEFYGEQNDGTLDARLYRPESAQPHQFYNLYSDTTAYFLTWNLTPTNGKRMASFSENNVGGLPAESSHAREVLELVTENYSTGRSFDSGDVTRYTFFDIGEGWTSGLFQEGESRDVPVSGITNEVQADGDPLLEVLLVGRDNVSHLAEVFVGPNAGSLRSLGTVSFTDYETHLFSAAINWSDVSAGGDLVVHVAALGASGGNDRVSVSYVRLRYPESMNADSSPASRFNLDANPGNKSYVEISNAPVNPRLFDITDKSNVIKIGLNVVGSSINAIVPNTASSRSIHLNGDNFLTPIIKKSGFRQFDPSNNNYIIITHRLLRQSSGGVSDPVEAYASYRASAIGGGYDTLSIDIEQLYNQFNYGETSALAIYDFMRYMVDLGNPQYLFLIGKGLGPEYNFHRNPAGFVEVTKLGVTHRIRDLVPSAGNPGADMLFTAGLGATTYEPAVPVGRLPANTSSQVVNYLNKVKEHANTPFDDLWRKQVLHLSGGLTVFELSQFRSFMNGFAMEAESEFFGGDVETIAKQSNSTVELINVADEVNDGLNLITFFGHSSPSVIDIDIGFATDPVMGYNNKGRYPTFLINGCNAGQFFAQNILFGEDWITAADKGAINFIAHTSYGFSSSLKRYTDTFYQTAYGDSVFINKTIGEVQQEVAKRYMDGASEIPRNITQSRQMTLLGDPAVSLFGADKPDYELNDDNVYVESFNNEPVSAESDSFALKFIVRNFGRTHYDSLAVKVTRTLADNTTMVYDSIYPSVKFSDTLTFVVDNDIANGSGNNRLMVEIDYNSAIDELNETNNSGLLNLFIPFFGTKNLYPINYSIVNSQPVELLAQSSSLLSDNRNFLFELDTVNTFDSPFKKQTSVNERLLASWTVTLLPDITANDSTVYFWRTKYATTEPGESDEWTVSSFIYIKDGPEGWSQSVYSQYDNNVLEGLARSESQKTLEFVKTQTDVFIRTYGAGNPATIEDISVQMKGAEYNIDNLKRCRDNTLNLIAFDKTTSIPYAGVPLIFQDVRTCGRRPQVINSFRRSEMETGSDDVFDFVDNVTDGDSVILYTIGDPQFSNWSAALKTKLGELGISSTDISALQDGEPLILLGKKGTNPGDATFITADTPPEDEQELSVSTTVSGIFSDGSMQSTTVGPASAWQSIRTDYTISELPQTDVFSIDIFGISSEGDEVLLMGGQSANSIDITSIDPNQYPRLRLVYKTSDPSNLTAAQLDKWQVLYTGVPEGILLVDQDFKSSQNQPEGQQVDLQFGFKNISKKTFPDSLIVDYTLFNQDRRSSNKKNLTIKSPEVGDTTSFNLTINTLGQDGKNDFNLFVNPRLVAEQYYENNILDIKDYLEVEKDNINPLIDVVFDGQRILDGEIVSPSPLISVVLRDENVFLNKTDTVGVNIFIKKPCETCTFERVPFSSNRVQWFPATEEEDFKVDYQPERLEDGLYTLRVEASDASGNESGDEPYAINFEVVNESSITNFYPYPNPFSTSTRFIFTLTGTEIPDQIKIQIMTVSGRVVREITQNELGPIRVGNNVSDYAWDGKDEFGDQLANGVYLYRVIVKSAGKQLDNRSTSADKAFKKGFGKLYLLR